MVDADRKPFADLIAGVFAYHRQPVTPAIIGVYWRACQPFELEQVTKAIDALTVDPEAGKFAPKIADIVRVLQGTQTDRALIAWGKVSGALSDVGRMSDVVFDDPIIHLCVMDHGGWPKFCTTPYDEQSYLQHAFCQSYRAYAARGMPAEYPSRLVGETESQAEYDKVGMTRPAPALVGDRAAARLVLERGTAMKRLAGQPVLGLLPPNVLVRSA